MERRRGTIRTISQKVYIPSLLFLIFFGIYYESSILTTPHHTVDAKSCKTQHRLRYRGHPVSSIPQIRQDCGYYCDDDIHNSTKKETEQVSTPISHAQCRAFFHLNFFPSNLYPNFLPSFTRNGSIPFVNESSPFSSHLPINVSALGEKRTLIIGGYANYSSSYSNSNASSPLPLHVSILTSMHNLTAGDSTRIYSSEEFERKFVCNDLPPFDIVIVADLNEHLNPWNDLITVSEAWCVTKAHSKLILLFPVEKFSGTDAIFNDLRRSYARPRLRYITRNWKQVGERKYFNEEESQATIAFTFTRLQ